MKKLYVVLVYINNNPIYYCARVLGLKGAITQADSMKELEDNVSEVISLVTNDKRDDYELEFDFVDEETFNNGE